MASPRGDVIDEGPTPDLAAALRVSRRGRGRAHPRRRRSLHQSTSDGGRAGAARARVGTAQINRMTGRRWTSCGGGDGPGGGRAGVGWRRAGASSSDATSTAGSRAERSSLESSGTTAAGAVASSSGAARQQQHGGTSSWSSPASARATRDSSQHDSAEAGEQAQTSAIGPTSPSTATNAATSLRRVAAHSTGATCQAVDVQCKGRRPKGPGGPGPRSAARRTPKRAPSSSSVMLPQPEPSSSRPPGRCRHGAPRNDAPAVEVALASVDQTLVSGHPHELSLVEPAPTPLRRVPSIRATIAAGP